MTGLKKQEIKGDVGNVVSGSVNITNHHYSDDGQQLGSEPPILGVQKRDLHEKMDALVLQGESKRELWLMLHRHCNVATVDEMTVGQYHQAVEYLDSYAEKLQYKKDCKELVRTILKLTKPPLDEERNRYCLKHMGTTLLNSMSKEQLQSVFAYFDNVLSDLEHSAATTENVEKPIPETGETASIKKNNVAKWLVLAVFITIGGGVAYSLKPDPTTAAAIEPERGFTVETKDKVIASELPNIRSVFPGLDKYQSSFSSSYTYIQKSGWHTLAVKVSGDSEAGNRFKTDGVKCFINLSPDGDYARVLKEVCRKIFLNRDNTPDSKFRFHLN